MCIKFESFVNITRSSYPYNVYKICGFYITRKRQNNIKKEVTEYDLIFTVHST